MSSLEGARLSPPVNDADHSHGPHDATVTLVEYGDYECPHCGRAHPIVKEVQRRLGARLRFVFRNFPLAQAHPHATQAAEAAEAAATQGKFWEMHDRLFEHQMALDEPHLLQHAETLGLDREQFHADLAAHTYAERVRRDFVSGVRSGVNGTPTFFIDGIRYDDAWDLETLEEALRATAREP
jgi:protein-disulfide isomerase